MHFPERRPDQTEERILPLINVVFLLLIFFMITGSLTVSEPFEVEPTLSESDADTEPDSLVVLISREGNLALDGRILSEKELLVNLETALKKDPDAQIYLKTDSNLTANRLVAFTQLLHEHGVEKLRLLTLPEDT